MHIMFLACCKYNAVCKYCTCTYQYTNVHNFLIHIHCTYIIIVCTLSPQRLSSSMPVKTVKLKVKPAVLFKVRSYEATYVCSCLYVCHSLKVRRTCAFTLCFNCFLQPVDHQGNLIPDPEADYYLFDRVINVSTTNAVPFGLRGTVMGIYGGKLHNIIVD